MVTKVTRGNGYLEGFLARKRSAMANRLIDSNHRQGRILDIGCGSSPFFLQSVKFSQKIGLDKMVTDEQIQGFSKKDISLIRHDITSKKPLPFSGDNFDVITMLAVFEHIEPSALQVLIGEIYRILQPGGEYILTTPAGWTDPILRTMAKLHLVSSEEIDEHQDEYTLKIIKNILIRSGFKEENITLGSFELKMNLWAKSVK